MLQRPSVCLGCQHQDVHVQQPCQLSNGRTVGRWVHSRVRRRSDLHVSAPLAVTPASHTTPISTFAVSAPAVAPSVACSVIAATAAASTAQLVDCDYHRRRLWW